MSTLGPRGQAAQHLFNKRTPTQELNSPWLNTDINTVLKTLWKNPHSEWFVPWTANCHKEGITCYSKIHHLPALDVHNWKQVLTSYALFALIFIRMISLPAIYVHTVYPMIVWLVDWWAKLSCVLNSFKSYKCTVRSVQDW